MNPLNIIINLLKKGSGAAEAKGELEGVKRAAGEAGEEAQKSGGRFFNFAGLTQRVMGALGVQMNQFSRLVLSLAGNVQALGRAFGVALTGGIATVINIVLAVAAVFSKFWTDLREGKKQTEDAAKGADDLAGSQADLSEKTRDAGRSADESKDRHRELEEAFRRARTAASELNSALDELEEAKKKQAIANLDLLRSQQKISEEDYDIQRARIETGSALTVLNRKREGIDAEIGEKFAELKRLEDAFAQASIKAGEAREAFKAAGGDASVDYQAEQDRLASELEETQKKARRAQDNAQVMTLMGPGMEKEMAKAREQADAARKEAVEKEDAVKKAKQLAAIQSGVRDAERDASEAFASLEAKRPAIKTEIDTLQKRREAVDYTITAEQQAGAARAIEAERRAKERAEREKPPAVKPAPETPPPTRKTPGAARDGEPEMTPDQRMRRILDDVQPYHRTPRKELIGEDVGRATQQAARAEIQKAGRRIQAGEEDARVVSELVATLQRLGAVMGKIDLSQLKRQLDLLDGKIELLESRLRSGRD